MSNSNLLERARKINAVIDGIDKEHANYQSVKLAIKNFEKMAFKDEADFDGWLADIKETHTIQADPAEQQKATDELVDEIMFGGSTKQKTESVENKQQIDEIMNLIM